MWVPDHLTPSWVCLPNDQPVLTIIKPGESVLCVLETICKVTAPSLKWPWPTVHISLQWCLQDKDVKTLACIFEMKATIWPLITFNENTNLTCRVRKMRKKVSITRLSCWVKMMNSFVNIHFYLQKNESPISCCQVYSIKRPIFFLFALIPQAHQLDPTKHYLRLKFLIENQVQFYIPKPEEDVCDLVCNSPLENDLIPPSPPDFSKL